MHDCIPPSKLPNLAVQNAAPTVQLRDCKQQGHQLLDTPGTSPALTTKLMALRMSVISSTGTLPPVSLTSTAAMAKMNAATSTQDTPEDHKALQICRQHGAPQHMIHVTIRVVAQLALFAHLAACVWY